LQVPDLGVIVDGVVELVDLIDAPNTLVLFAIGGGDGDVSTRTT